MQMMFIGRSSRGCRAASEVARDIGRAGRRRVLSGAVAGALCLRQNSWGPHLVHRIVRYRC